MFRAAACSGRREPHSPGDRRAAPCFCAKQDTGQIHPAVGDCLWRNRCLKCCATFDYATGYRDTAPHLRARPTASHKRSTARFATPAIRAAVPAGMTGMRRLRRLGPLSRRIRRKAHKRTHRWAGGDPERAIGRAFYVTTKAATAASQRVGRGARHRLGRAVGRQLCWCRMARCRAWRSAGLIGGGADTRSGHARLLLSVAVSSRLVFARRCSRETATLFGWIT